MYILNKCIFLNSLSNISKSIVILGIFKYFLIVELDRVILFINCFLRIWFVFLVIVFIWCMSFMVRFVCIVDFIKFLLYLDSIDRL